MKKSIHILIFLLVVSLLQLACKKFVQIAPPTTQLVTTSVFNNNAAATSAQTAIYSQMANNGESAYIALYLGLLSDELTNYFTTSSTFVQYYTNTMVATNNSGPWNDAYNYIYQANAILSAVQGNAALSPVVAQQLIGESKFIRAFWLFYLTNLYGDIPLPTTPKYAVNAVLARTPRSQVYQQIVNDLKNAQSALNPYYVDGSDTAITKSDRGRPTKWAAASFLARVYLYTGDYPDAESEADSVISNTNLYSLCSDLNKVFLVNSPEAIWQLDVPLPATYNTLDGADFILLSAPPSSGYCSISPQLLASFEPNDNRRKQWIDSFRATSPAFTYYYPYKYKVQTGSTITENVMVLRLAEQYLIRAEARAKQNNLSGATADLNVIRERSNLPAYVGPVDQHSIIYAITHERQVELFTEWGHRWLDLIRSDAVDSVMSVVSPLKGGSWSADNHQTLFPIPQSEIVVDANLTQNLGY